ncbi:GAF domain-containing protein [Halorussus halobius]|uniref:GAF domain-containing protein n=1 Tax=Halorussus halobius TaxID=1710537 RepID=UPI0010932499|nr:GAF domain-containing protein [Halorussus halobius]
MAHSNDAAGDSPRSPGEEVFDRIPDAVVALNRDWEFTYLDGNAEALLDRDAEELLGTDIREAFPAIEGTAFEREYERAMETQSTVSFEEYYSPLDAWFEVRAHPSETGLSVLFAPVSEERRRSRELDRYETLVESLDDGVFAVDDTGTFLAVNEAYASLTGYSREELLGRTPALLADDETSAECEAARQRLLSGECDAVTTSADLVTAAGDRVPTETTLSRFSSGGEAGVVGVTRETSRRTRYERRLELLHDATRDVMAATTRREVCEVVLEATEGILDLPGLAIYFWDEAEGRLVPELTTEDCEELFDELPTFEGGESLAWDAFVENDLRVYDDVRTEEDCFNPETVIRSELLAPLGDHGVLVSGSTEPGFYESAHVDLISVLAANATVALDRVERQQRVTARREELRRQTRRLEQLARVNNVVRDVQRALVGASTRREAAANVCEHVVDVDPYRFAWVGNADRSGPVRPDAWAGEDGDFLDHLNESRDADEASRSPAERAVETGERVVVDNIFHEESFPQWRKEALGRGFQSALSLPLTGEGTVHGVIEIYASEANAFDDDVQEVFSDLCRIVADGIEIIERRQLVTSANDVEVELHATAGDSFLADVARGAGAELRVDSATLRDDGTWLLYVTTGTDVAEDVRSRLDASTVVESVEHIRTGSAGELFGVVASAFEVGRILMEYGATLTELSVSAETVTLSVRIGQNVAVRGLADAYDDVLPDVALVRREPVDDRESDDSSPPALTDRQREVLRAAYDAGYFEWPREATGEDVADALGISNPVFHRHVRRALQKRLTREFGR